MSDDNVFKNDDIHSKVDGILSRTPAEIKRVEDNLDFVKELNDKPVPSDTYTIDVFGFETVDISAILKNNIWNRSIFTVDKLCKLFMKMDLEQKKKYLRKKRALEFNYAWLLLLIIGIPALILVVVFLLPRLGAIFGGG